MKIKITANFRTSRRLPFEDWKRIMSPKMRPKSLGTFERRDRFVGFHYFRSTQRTKWNQEKAKAKQIALHTRCMTALQSLTDHLRKKMKTIEWKRQRWWRKWNGWEAWKEGKFLSAGHWQLLVLLRLFSRFYYGQWILTKNGLLRSNRGIFLSPLTLPRTGGSVGWALGCHAGGREFDSGS